MHLEFFMPMIPPTVTHQEKKVRVVNGKPKFYEPTELKAARVKLRDHLAKHKPEAPFTTAVGLEAIWAFPCGDGHTTGEYRTTKPDTDNLQKLLKDVMTALGFWTDDALVAIESVGKIWTMNPGIYIRVIDLEEEDKNA